MLKVSYQKSYGFGKTAVAVTFYNDTNIVTENESRFSFKLLIPLIISLIAFSIYLFGLAPTISAGDSGELVAAGTTLGIAHPSGYPLYCLIGKFFSFVFPFASYAYRINLVSAFFCAATAGVVYRIFENYIVVQRFGGTGFQPVNRIIEIVLSLSIVFLPVFWSQAVVSEVFALNIFLITILIWIIAKVDVSKNPPFPPLIKGGEGGFSTQRYFLLFSFILGLGLGNHQTIALVGLGLIAPYLIRLLKNKKLLFLCLLFFLLGFSINLYLLLRAQQHPLVNWSNPSNWQSFLRVITRADYGTFNLHQEIQAKYSWGLILQQFKHFFNYLVFVPFGLFGWLGLLFVGITVIKRAVNRTEWLAFLLSGLLFILLSRLPMDAWSKTVITRFYLPAVLIFYLWAGRGIMYIFRIADFGVILGLVLPIYLVSYNLSYHNERQNFFIYDYGKNILRTLAKDTILFVEKVQDDAVFSLIYLNLVERRRTDCRFTESEVRVFPVVYGPDYVRMDAAHRFARRREIQEQIVRMQEKPVYFLAISRDDLTQFSLYPQGLLYRAYERPVSLRLPDIFWNIYNLRASPLVGEGKGEGKDLDYRTRALIVSYPLQRAEYYWHNGEKKLTEEDCRLAEKLGYDIDWVQNNLGNFYRLIGNPDKARRWLNIAVTQKPNYDIAWYNLGLVYEAEKNWPEALNSYKKAWEINPQDKDIHRRLELSALYWAYQLYGENEREQALQIYEFVKKINPHQPLAYYNSSLIYADLGQPQRAEEEMKKYRQLVSPKAKK